MVRQIPFTKYEAALLLDAYLKVLSGDLSRMDSVKKCSQLLRAMAVNSGIEIDDIYRNVNGISFQMASMESAYQGKTIMKPATQLFTEIVQLFRENNKEYHDWLNKAKDMANAKRDGEATIRQAHGLCTTNPAKHQMILDEAHRITETLSISVEDAFFAYAKDKTGIPSQMLVDYLQKAADYCHLKQPLLGMTDAKAVHNAQKKVAEGKLLRFRFGKNAQAIRNVTQLYYAFIKSYHESKEDDYGKQIIRMSDSCSMDFPPDPAFQISLISNAAKAKPAIWIGAAQAKMLYGQQPTEQFLINLLGTSFAGPVTVVCPFCCNILEGIARSYAKLGYNIIVMSNGERNIPVIHVSSKKLASQGTDSAQDIRALLCILEDGKYGADIHLTTSCKAVYLERSMYPVSEGLKSYQVLCKMDPGIAANTSEQNETPEQQQKLVHDVQKVQNFSNLCVDRMCAIQNLANEFGDYLAGSADDRFLCFICLKVFYSGGNDYLAYCLEKSQTVDFLEQCIYTAILNIDYRDKRFFSWMRQRRRILSTLDDNSAMMQNYCDQATIKRKDILWYLSDETEEERAALIHALCSYSYAPDELNQVLSVVSPQLAAYLQQFVFDEFNTKVMESDAYIRELLTDYFQRYKFQKLTSRG